MSNKTNHRRPHGQVRRRNPHSPGRKVCGVCGPLSRVQRDVRREKQAREETRNAESFARRLKRLLPEGWNDPRH